MRSAVLILPVELKSQGDQIGEAMGWGPVSYTIPLSSSLEVTHYGLRADVSEQFVDWIVNRNNLPNIPFNDTSLLPLNFNTNFVIGARAPSNDNWIAGRFYGGMMLAKQVNQEERKVIEDFLYTNCLE